MGYAILRIAARKSTGSALKMAKHALREDQVPNAIEGAPAPINAAGQGYGHASSKEAMAALYTKIEAAKAVRAGWQKTSTAALDILVTASRPDMLAWPLAKQNQFFAKALDFIAAKFGGKQNILVAAIHRDEATPHMQVILAPVNAEGRFSASKMVGGRDQLSQLQTDFHAVCGQPFNLERGIPRTKAKHVPVRAFYGAMEKGLEPPAYVDVPAAPSMVDNVKGTYKAKKAAYEAALAANAVIRQEVHKQAQRGRTVHPKVIERQAEIYRRGLAFETRNDQRLRGLNERAIELDRGENNLSETLASIKPKLEAERQKWLGIVDQFSAKVQPEYRAMLAQQLGIQLKPGKLLDQIRRAGLAPTAKEAMNLLDQVTQGEFTAAALRRHEVDRDREVPDTEAPRPGG